MSSKYHPSTPATLVTNDLYLAAFLHCVGCILDHVERNERRRVSFVFIGERVQELREAYRTGPVKLDMRSFKDSLVHLRRQMDGELDQKYNSTAALLLHAGSSAACGCFASFSDA